MLSAQDKMVTALITGGAGFIGSHLAEACALRGWRVIILDNFSTGLSENIFHIIPQISIHNVDITDIASCLPHAQEVDIIFHLAAHTSVPESLNAPYQYYENNIRGTYAMLEIARRCKIPYFVFSSSAAVYGAHEGICDEHTTPCKPLSPYGTSKLIGEQLCKEYGMLYGIRSTCLRYFNVYGNRQRTDLPQAGIVARLNDAMRNNKPITIYGDGFQKRDFVPVEEVVRANIQLAQLLPQNNWQGEVFNIASGRSVSLRSLIKELHTKYPQYDISQITFAPERPGDIRISAAECQKYTLYR